MSNKLRITGMATGMDTDTTVKQLMKPWQMKLDKLNQTKQIKMWTQDIYRDLIGEINSFRNQYFDILKTDSYMLSGNSYKNFESKVYEQGTATVSNAVTVSTNSDAQIGTYNIDFTGGQLAVGAGVQSNGTVVGAKLTSKLSELGITTTQITVGYTDKLGVAQTKNVDIDPATMTVSGLASKINTLTASQVSAKFSEISGKFVLQNTNTGETTALSITDNTAGNLIEKLNLGAGGALTTDNTDLIYGIAGEDLSVKITAAGATTTVTSDKNTYTADGITFNFTAARNTDITISKNVQKSFDKVKAFVDKYNELIDKISNKVEERKQYKYVPLTDEQKAAMNEDDIKKWEEKAKTGLVSGDSVLSRMLSTMRGAFYSSVQDAGIELKQVGLSTSSDTSQRGKIIIDETKLKLALENTPDLVSNLFSQKSKSKPSYDPDAIVAAKTTRYNEEGIFQRINDIMMDLTRTTRDDSGKKGILLEKAGIKGDFSELNNLITKDIFKQDSLINTMTKKMATQENRYYSQFAKLESAMNNMNSQSSWLAKQLGSSGS